MKFEVLAHTRTVRGTGHSRRLRRAGRVPGIVYGGDRPPVAIELDHRALIRQLADERFHASILTLNIDGQTEPVLLRAFHMHPVRPLVQHVDFQRVSKDKKIHVKVPLHFINADRAPGVKEQGGIANHVMNEIDVRCLPDDLPEYIEVDMGAMRVGDSIHARDLAYPKGVEPVLHRGENPVVATIIVPALVTEEEEAAAAAAQPAPSEVPATEQAAASEAEKKEKK